MNNLKLVALAFCSIFELALNYGFAQGVQPYPNAITDRVVRKETPKLAPRAKVLFKDPDLGSLMIRVTDPTTNPRRPGGYFRSPAVGETTSWSADDKKFYVIGEGGVDFAFGFDPATMAISSLPGAKAGQPLALGLRPGPTFSFIDPDLIYGTTHANRFTISQYRFSTGKITSVLDTTTCGVQPPLDPSNPSVQSDDDLSVAADDSRISLSEGGPQTGQHTLVVVYDKELGCRWYNTQTGQIGGQWGISGYASVPGFLINHARISGDGKFIRITAYNLGFYLWNLETLNVAPCHLHTSLECGGYGSFGRSTYINSTGKIDEMNIVKRPADNLAAISPLIWPLPTVHAWEQEKHFAWTNGYLDDNNPICASVYNYDGDRAITRAWDDEIVCIETDGVASTVWRFAHHRTYWVAPYFNTQPLGNISQDGRFFLFTSTWDGQLGREPNGTPRSDMWIVKLD
jgi:hypothetical protein